MSLEVVFTELRKHHGAAFADRWLTSCSKAPKPEELVNAPLLGFKVPPQAAQEPLYPHSSHVKAAELLEPYREALGPAYTTLHLLARWSVEHATEQDPAPHMLTTYWTLEEATGKTERTLIRHLVEDGHSWSDTVRSLVDIRHNYGVMRQGDVTRPCIVGTVIRFFPKGRQTKNAKVKRWAERDLIVEADAGRTRPSRQTYKGRYQRSFGRMSAYSPIKIQAEECNWVMFAVGQSVSNPAGQDSFSDNLYADIATNHVLHALHADLDLALRHAAEAGHSVTRTRSSWVDRAARVLARRFGDTVPRPGYVPVASRLDQQAEPGTPGQIGYRGENGCFYPVYADGFLNLWRRALWTAVRVELYGSSNRGWTLLLRMVLHAVEARRAGKSKPSAWAWSVIKREGFSELLRDYQTGTVA